MYFFFHDAPKPCVSNLSKPVLHQCNISTNHVPWMRWCMITMKGHYNAIQGLTVVDIIGIIMHTVRYQYNSLPGVIGGGSSKKEQKKNNSN